MYTYTAYDLQLRSVFKLPELPAVEDNNNARDVEIIRGTVEPVPDSVKGTGGRRVLATPEAVRLTYESVGSFRVEDGTRITCDPLDKTASQREFFRRLIENELLGLILYQRDHLVLHASAVSVNGKAAMFIGPRGAGKSTTAAAFGAQGYSVLEDDIVAIRFNEGAPTVLPGVPQLRLKSDAAAAIGVKETTTPSEESWYDKHMLSIGEIPEPAPLAGCYILSESDVCSLKCVNGSDQILNLISRTQARGLLDDTGRSSTHLDQCAQVSEMVPFRLLERPRNHDLLPSVVEMVVEDLTTR